LRDRDPLEPHVHDLDPAGLSRPLGTPRRHPLEGIVADLAPQFRPHDVVEASLRPGVVHRTLEEGPRVAHPPADENVQVDRLLLLGQEFRGPGVIDPQPLVNPEDRLVGHLEIKPRLLERPQRAAEKGDDRPLGLVHEHHGAIRRDRHNGRDEDLEPRASSHRC